MEETTDIQGGVPILRARQNPAIQATDHIKPTLVSRVDRCRVVRQVREEAESLNDGTLFANRGGIGVEDYEVTMLIDVD
jgi:hypothetical protein